MTELATPARARLSTGSRRALKAAAIFVVGFLLLVVAGHAAPLRPLLARFGGGAALCPVVGKLDPKEIESQRAAASHVLAGSGIAKARIAGPFVILGSTRTDVEAWASAARATCSDEIAKTALRCRDVPGRALTSSTLAESAPERSIAGSDVFVRFDPAGKLVGFDVMRSPADPAAAASLASALLGRIEQDVGPRSATHGQLDAAYFDTPGMKLTSVAFHFSDYAVDVSVSRLDERGPLVVREQYRAVSSPAEPSKR